MDEPLTTHVFYNYEENRCVLDIRYDPEKAEITITGGRHGFARLAELFAIYAQLDVPQEHHHWWLVKGGPEQLMVVLKDDLRKG
jgi:hypothetical protein